MSRNVQLQILRGPFAALTSLVGGIDYDTGATVSPLALGEMFFATDTNAFYLGTPGIGIGYIQVGDTTQMAEQLAQLIVIMESMRRATVTIACQDGKAREIDFDPATISEELASSQPLDF
jgi:hypothetical protein